MSSGNLGRRRKLAAGVRDLRQGVNSSSTGFPPIEVTVFLSEPDRHANEEREEKN